MRYLLNLITILTVMFASSAVAGVNVGSARVLITGPDGAPIKDALAYLQLKGQTSYLNVGIETSDSDGMVTFENVFEGQYRLLFRPSESVACGACGRLQDKTGEDFDIDIASPSYDSAAKVFSLGTTNLAQVSRYISVTVTEAATPDVPTGTALGDVVAGISVSGSDSKGTVFNTTTGADGRAYIPVSESNSSKWQVHVYPFGDNDYTDARIYDIEAAASGETAVSTQVIPVNASVDMTLLDKRGAPFTLGNSQLGTLYCQSLSRNHPYSFSKFLDPGMGYGRVRVIGGLSYRCSLSMNGHGASSSTITVAAGGTTSTSVKIFPRDASVSVRVVDASGATLTGVKGIISAFSEKDATGGLFRDYASGSISDGIAPLSLVDDGLYKVSIWFSDSISSNSQVTVSGIGSYLRPLTYLDVIGDNERAQTLDLVLQRSDATISVVATSTTGAPLANASVSAVEVVSRGSVPLSSLAFTNEAGRVDVPVVGEKMYRVFVYPSVTTGGALLPPPIGQVVVNSGETKELSLQAIASNHTLAISPVTDGGVSLNYIDCYAYNRELCNVSAGTTTLQLVTGKQYQVGCTGQVGNTFYRSDESEYLASGNGSTVSVKLAPIGTFYEDRTSSFSCGADATITLPDGQSSLYIPAGSVGDSGVCTITIGTAVGQFLNRENFPVYGFKFEVKDSSGVKKSAFTTTLVLTLVYDPAELPEGMDSSSLTGRHYEAARRSFTEPVGVEVRNREDGKIEVKISLKEFSSYSIVGVRSTGPDAPTNLKAKILRTHPRGRKKSAKLSWSTPSGTTRYEYQVRRTSRSDRNKSSSQRFSSARSKLVTKAGATVLLTAGTYELRVRALDAHGPGAYSVPKRFVVRP